MAVAYFVSRRCSSVESQRGIPFSTPICRRGFSSTPMHAMRISHRLPHRSDVGRGVPHSIPHIYVRLVSDPPISKRRKSFKFAMHIYTPEYRQFRGNPSLGISYRMIQHNNLFQLKFLHQAICTQRTPKKPEYM